MKISVIGLGKLGACTAACFAWKGFDVIGVDVNKRVIEMINNGRSPVHEPGLQELIERSRGRLKATDNYEMAMRESDITFLILPTPSRDDGFFSDAYLRDALKKLSDSFKGLNKYHIFVITSTVSPGTIEENLIPLVESTSGKKLNRDFGVVYNPEFIALGSIIRDFLNPDLVLIGESDKSAGDRVEEIYKIICENKPYIARMSIISAEITKLSLNAYLTMKISFANTLSNICERIPGADIDKITRALGADRRVSPYYLRGGMGYGGPCFPRDVSAFSSFAKKYGIDAKLARATEEVNNFQISHLVDIVLRHLPPCFSAIGVLGLSYKPGTPVIDESPSVKLIEEILKRKPEIKIIVYDPLAMDNAKSHFGNRISYSSSVRDCLRSAPLCVVALPDENFKKIDESFIVHNPTVLIDCWRILESLRFSKKVKYIGLGKNLTKSPF